MKNKIESNVSYYNSHFKTRFSKAKNALLYSDKDEQYIDFFSAAGSLNYGHNNEYIKSKIIEYVEADNIIQGLDMDTVAKEEFFKCFLENILKPRGLDYKLQLSGPAGTNAVEAALRLARKVTGRNGIFSLTGSFHGMSTSSLSVSSTKSSRLTGLPSDNGVTFIPFSVTDMDGYDPITYIKFLLNHEHSGVEKPAAFIIETVQAEGGVKPLSNEVLRGLQDICNEHNILLICDDIQVGCYRTGTFFSFEESGIVPDIVVLSKSLSGYGIPMSILLMKPSLDIWGSGEYNGTFRGNQLAFVGAKSAIEFGISNNITQMIDKSSEIIKTALDKIVSKLDKDVEVRGKGMIWGIDFNVYDVEGIALACAEECFENGLIIEVCGTGQNVLKLMPPLTIDEDVLLKGLDIIENAVLKTVSK